MIIAQCGDLIISIGARQRDKGNARLFGHQWGIVVALSIEQRQHHHRPVDVNPLADTRQQTTSVVVGRLAVHLQRNGGRRDGRQAAQCGGHLWGAQWGGRVSAALRGWGRPRANWKGRGVLWHFPGGLGVSKSSADLRGALLRQNGQNSEGRRADLTFSY